MLFKRGAPQRRAKGPHGFLLELHEFDEAARCDFVTCVLCFGDNLPFLFENVREGFSEHAIACAVVHDPIGGLDCGALKALGHGGDGVAFQTADAATDGVGGNVCVSDKVRKHFCHGRILFSPPVPKGASCIEAKHLEIGEKPIQTGDQAVGPAAVELSGEGGVHRGHGEAGL